VPTTTFAGTEEEAIHACLVPLMTGEAATIVGDESQANSSPAVPYLLVRQDRNKAVDALRGLVMIIMALDHTRDFFRTPPRRRPDCRGRWVPSIQITRKLSSPVQRPSRHLAKRRSGKRPVARPSCYGVWDRASGVRDQGTLSNPGWRSPIPASPSGRTLD
jgi:hypothetical protein